MKQLTEQQIFNRVAKHLLRQKKRSVGRGGGCVYRGPNGLQCAIGCLIPDSLYGEELEGVLANELPAKILREAKLGASEKRRIFLSDLQYIHDVNEPKTWRADLRTFANESGLSFRP